jgi:hypothetical protein
MQISRELAEQWAFQHGYTDLQYVPGNNPEGGGQWFGFRDSKDMMPLPLPQEFYEWAELSFLKEYFRGSKNLQKGTLVNVTFSEISFPIKS